MLNGFRGYIKTIAFGALCGATGILYEKFSKFSVSAKTLQNVDDNIVYPDNVKSLSKVPEIMKFGYPSYENLKKMNDFVMAYDQRIRSAKWVVERFKSEDFEQKSSVNRAGCEFYEDKTVHKFFRSTNLDYKQSGYDRGHLAAAGNHKASQEDCNQTFALTNISPQVGKGFNRNMWNNLEKYVRKLTKSYKHVYVCTGPLFLSRKEANGKYYVKYEVIGPNQVAVPTHFFKVIVGETMKNEYDLEAYVLPNQSIDDKISLKSFLVSVESIERAAGFLLFDKIPRSSFRKIN